MISIRSSLASVSAVATSMLFATAAWATSLSTVPEVEGATDLNSGVINVVNAVLDFVAIVVLVLIVIAGFRIMLSQGDETARDGAKKTIIYLIIGLIIVVFAKALAKFIVVSIGNVA